MRFEKRISTTLPNRTEIHYMMSFTNEEMNKALSYIKKELEEEEKNDE